MQVLFRSVNKLLMDTATAEYLFCCDFFQEDTIFSELFTTTLAVVESSLAASIQVGASKSYGHSICREAKLARLDHCPNG